MKSEHIRERSCGNCFPTPDFRLIVVAKEQVIMQTFFSFYPVFFSFPLISFRCQVNLRWAEQKALRLEWIYQFFHGEFGIGGGRILVVLIAGCTKGFQRGGGGVDFVMIKIMNIAGPKGRPWVCYHQFWRGRVLDERRTRTKARTPRPMGHKLSKVYKTMKGNIINLKACSITIILLVMFFSSSHFDQILRKTFFFRWNFRGLDIYLQENGP